MGQWIPPRTLSDRHVEVLTLLAEGSSNEEIAKQLYLSVDTVKTHVKGVMFLLHAKNRTHAVVIALQRGLLPAVGNGLTRHRAHCNLLSPRCSCNEPPISAQHRPQCASHRPATCNCDLGGKPYTATKTRQRNGVPA